jgi:hypothetical protein
MCVLGLCTRSATCCSLHQIILRRWGRTRRRTRRCGLDGGSPWTVVHIGDRGGHAVGLNIGRAEVSAPVPAPTEDCDWDEVEAIFHYGCAANGTRMCREGVQSGSSVVGSRSIDSWSRGRSGGRGVVVEQWRGSRDLLPRLENKKV